MEEQPVWMGFVAKVAAGAIVAGALKLGLHLDATEVIGVLLMLEAAIAAKVQTKTTSMKKLERVLATEQHQAVMAALAVKK